MRDIPPVAWILGAFFFLALGTFAYYRSGPDVWPNANTVWSFAGTFHDNVEARRMQLEVGKTVEQFEAPYKFAMTRLSDVDIRTKRFGRYVLRVDVTKKIPVERNWVGDGITIGWIDLKPGDSTGDVRLVSVLKSALQK